MDTEEKVNILLVDDTPSKLMALKSILADLNQNLVEAHSGKEALRHLLQGDYAAILLDVHMPEMDGFETAELIRQRERSQSTPIIFVTAISTTEVDRARGYRLGAVDYIFAPVVPEILRTKVTVFVDLFKKTRQIQAQAAELASLNTQLETQVRDFQRLNRELQSVNKELETFSYSVSHDLKAPLRGIEGFARILQERYRDRLDEMGRHYLDMVQGSAQRMGALIDDLLQYSRVERRVMQWGPVDLERLLQDLVADRQAEIESRGVRIDRHLSCARIAGEREGLQQALANLLDNALKFTRKVDQPAITISTRIVPISNPQTRNPPVPPFDKGGEGGIRDQSADQDVEISVADNGVGFDPQYRDKIFGIFERLHSLEEYEGTGIGLAIVRKVAGRHGGRAWAESTPGRGATFYLAIPMAKEGPDA